MKPWSLMWVVTVAGALAWSLANAQTPMQILQAGCAEDARKFCSNVQPGGGRIIACLKQNKDSLSDKCKRAAAQASSMTSEGAQGAPAPTAPPSGSTSGSTSAAGGGVFGGSPSGCFSDLYAINLQATSADGSTVFAAGPDYSWQYADDPSVVKSLNDPSRRALGIGNKPCPVDKPRKAEDDLR